MEIRSVTLFTQPDAIDNRYTDFLTEVRTAFLLPVQTTRLATPPFPEWWSPHTNTAEFVTHCQTIGADYVSIGPVQCHHPSQWLDAIPTLLTATNALFLSVEIADCDGNIDIERCHHFARIIQQVSTILDNGFGNLYMTAIANCPAGSPFFPVAYHAADAAPTFALALEAADLALTAIQKASTLNQARQNLITAITTTAATLSQQASQLAQKYNIPFSGLDFSLAPFPTADKSLAGALEALGVAHVGAPGSLFAAGFITEALHRADFQRCGFSGLMLPVLEDSILAQRAAAGQVSVQDLLSYAAVCGVGLDTIPLPGDVSEASLAGILLDTAVLATRLNKPLTARLMPLPNLKAGDPVTFDFPYFADSRVMAVRRGVTHLLSQATAISMHAIQLNKDLK